MLLFSGCSEFFFFCKCRYLLVQIPGVFSPPSYSVGKDVGICWDLYPSQHSGVISAFTLVTPERNLIECLPNLALEQGAEG